MVERNQLAKSDIFHLSTSNDSIALSLFSDWVSKKKAFCMCWNLFGNEFPTTSIIFEHKN